MNEDNHTKDARAHTARFNHHFHLFLSWMRSMQTAAGSLSCTGRPDAIFFYFNNHKTTINMKKNYLLMMVLTLFTAIGFTACSDDDESGVNLGTPPFEAVSGKYDVTSANSPYESIELGASGNYIVVLNNGGYAYATAVGGGQMAGQRSFLAERTAQTRAMQDGNIIYGTFTDLGNGRYELEGFGIIELVTNAGGQVTGIEVDSSQYGSASLTVTKETVVADSDMTNALCRTWRATKLVERDTNLATDETEERVIIPSQNPDAPREILLSKAGTYLTTYTDGSIDMGRWRWKDESQGTFYYAWQGDDWSNDAFVTIKFSGNTAVTYESWREDGYLYENYGYMETDETATDPTPDDDDMPVAPANRLSQERDGNNPNEILQQYTWSDGLVVAQSSSTSTPTEYPYTLAD